MKTNRTLGTVVVGAVLTVCAANASAEVGIGATVRSDVLSFYIPWQVAPQFRLEAEVSRLEDDSEQEQILFGTLDQPVFDFGSPSVREEQSEITEYGLGAFWTPELRDNWLLLVGMRVNYAKSESTISSSNFSAESELSGIEWAPTLGMEYELLEKIHLALEYSYYSRDLEGDSLTRTPGPSDSVNVSRSDLETDSSGTRTRIVLRYFF